MGILKAKKLGLRSKIFLFSKTVQDYGKRSADICLVMQAVGQAGHSLYAIAIISMRVSSIFAPRNSYLCFLPPSILWAFLPTPLFPLTTSRLELLQPSGLNYRSLN